MPKNKPERYFCAVCWRHISWSDGADDEADRAVAKLTRLRDPRTSDTGICSDCWVAFGGEQLRVTDASAVAA